MPGNFVTIYKNYENWTILLFISQFLDALKRLPSKQRRVLIFGAEILSSCFDNVCYNGSENIPRK